MDKYTGITNGIIRFLREDNNSDNNSKLTKWDRMLLFVRDNVRYTQSDARLQVAGHAYKVLRYDFLYHHVAISRKEADSLIDAFMDAGMTRTEIESMMQMYEDEETKESYGVEYRNFVGLVLAALLQLELKGNE